MTSFRDRWRANLRASEERGRQAEEAWRQKALGDARDLRAVPDDELIGTVGASTSLGYRPHREMEMQRRLKDSIEALTAESTKARIWAAWGTGVLAALTVVLVALTVVLAVKG